MKTRIIGLTKTCPECPPEKGAQPNNNFGVARSRYDGRNLYCKVCVRRKVYAGRVARREMIAARRAAQPEFPIEMPDGLPDRKPMMLARAQELTHLAEKVLRAIDGGARTQRDIRRLTCWPRLTEEEIGVALAELILNQRQVESYYSHGLEENVYLRRRQIARVA